MYRELANDVAVVQKYGGTSVGSVERIKNIAERVRRQHEAGTKKIAIVVSAMSGETNRIVSLVNDINPEANPKHYDLAVSAGEQVSVALLAAALESLNVPAKGFLGHQLGVVTSDFHSKARIQTIDTKQIEACWERGEVPVIAGFQGVSSSGENYNFRSRGSDTSAVALAVALKAGFCEINTDVDGVFSTDPRITSEAKLIEKMDFEVALEMASLGSKVLHARCVELGAKYKLPIVVRNTFKPDEHQRTLIMSLNENEVLEAPVVSGITLDRNVTIFNLTSTLEDDSDAFSKVFEKLALEGVNVDIIVHNRLSSSTDMNIGFSTNKTDTSKVFKALEGMNVKIQETEGLSKVSAVGLGMQSHPGVASRFFSILAKGGIESHMVSTSEIKISAVIEESKADEAVKSLHSEFV